MTFYRYFKNKFPPSRKPSNKPTPVSLSIYLVGISINVTCAIISSATAVVTGYWVAFFWVAVSLAGAYFNYLQLQALRHASRR